MLQGMFGRVIEQLSVTVTKCLRLVNLHRRKVSLPLHLKDSVQGWLAQLLWGL